MIVSASNEREKSNYENDLKEAKEKLKLMVEPLKEQVKNTNTALYSILLFLAMNQLVSVFVVITTGGQYIFYLYGFLMVLYWLSPIIWFDWDETDFTKLKKRRTMQGFWLKEEETRIKKELERESRSSSKN